MTTTIGAAEVGCMTSSTGSNAQAAMAKLIASDRWHIAMACCLKPGICGQAALPPLAPHHPALTPPRR
jgi:hypothetical protein